MNLTKGSLHRRVSLAISSSSSIPLLILTSFLLNAASPVLPFKAGHVEPVPGSAVMRRGYPMSSLTSTSSTPGQNSSGSRAAILTKLASPRREGRLPLPYDFNIATGFSPTNFYSQSQSIESHERPSPFTRFPTVHSPSASSTTSETAPSESQHQYHRLHHYQRIQRQGMKMKPTAVVTPTLRSREEPISLFTSADEGSSPGTRHATGTRSDDPAMSSVDIERYTQDTDLHTKQTETSISFVEALQSLSPSLPMQSSTETVLREDLVDGGSSSSRHNKGLFGSPSSLAIPQTLLPPSYLNLVAFRHIDGPLEKRSSDILNRIANYWINLSRNVTNNNASRRNSSYSNTSSSSTSAYPQPKSVGSSSSSNRRRLSSDDYDFVDDVLFNHAKNQISSDHHHHYGHRNVSDKRESSLRESDIQPGMYIPMEEEDSKSNEDVIITAKEQYMSLDDGDDSKNVDKDEIIGGDDDANHAHVDHKHSHQEKNGKTNNAGDSTSSESSVGMDFVDSKDSDSSSFHDDLFHHSITTTTTGTITAVMQKEQTREDSSSGRSNSKSEHARKSDRGENTARSSTIGGNKETVGFNRGSGSNTVLRNIGDVKRAESDKIWSLDSHFRRHDLIESAEDDGHEFYYGMTIGGFLKRELWTIPLFVLAALNMVLIILFEAYVLCRARGQSRRHLFLGQMLLLGLFMCSFLALLFAVQPSIVGCFVGRLGVGIIYSLIFSVLMVKCVFLLSLDRGVYLPASYQGILLFFAVMVQVAIDTQWVMMYPPALQTIESGRPGFLQCGTSFLQLLYSLGYVGFLVIMVGVLSGRAAYQGVVENYREAVYILISAVVTVPVAISWAVSGWMLQGRHQEACIAFGLVAHTLTIFLIMFMPKGRQLASLDKESICFEDQDDQCSGYSPSFFHFKPTTKNYKTTLWGDGNLYTTLEPTVSTINPNVFFHRNDFHSGMIY